MKARKKQTVTVFWWTGCGRAGNRRKRRQSISGRKTECHHDPQRFPAFKREYLAELVQNPKAAQFVSLVKEKLKEGNVTFVYAAKDETYNHVVILKSFVQEQLQ